MSGNKMTAEKAINILETAPGKDFYTVEYQEAFGIAIDALRETVVAESEAKRKSLKGTREYVSSQEAIKLLTKYVDDELCYSIKFQHAIELAVDVLRDKIRNKAHWIFSGDDEDYDGYYINCSKCGCQRKAYDRDCELDIPVACPHCGVPIDVNAWEVQAQVRERHPDLFRTLYKVVVIYDDGKVARPYTLTTRARDEEDAKQKAIADVVVNWIHNPEAEKDIYVDSVEEVV